MRRVCTLFMSQVEFFSTSASLAARTSWESSASASELVGQEHEGGIGWEEVVVL